MSGDAHDTPSGKAAIFGALTVVALSILIGSTVFFHYQEGWAWIDAWFFTVTTISTVGYGNLVPATDLGKIATTVLIFSGIGVFGLAAAQVADQLVSRRIHLRERQKDTSTVDHANS